MVVRFTTGSMSFCQQTAIEQLRLLEGGELTSVELTESYLQRIDAVDGRVGAFLSVDREQALAQAADVDKRRANGQSVGRLGGLPIAVKDVLCDRTQPTTCASRMLEHFRPPYDA